MGTGGKRVAFGVLTMALAAGGGCRAVEPLPEIQGGAELALRRGAAWATIKVRPPYAIGPRVNLKFSKNKVSGQLDSGVTDRRSGSSFRGSLSLTLTEEGIQGSGPFGGVAVDVAEAPEVLEFEGTWNGSRVTFKITADSVKGTVPIHSFGDAASLASVASCQYVLDKVTPDGAREGVSICGGMPEQTRLEVPRQVDAWLTRKELVVVLLALLSTPPTSSHEQRYRM